MTTDNRIVKVGIIGCGEITQVAHIPNLCFLSDLFTITYLCDVSAESLRHNAQKVINHIPRTTQDPAELCASKEVELVFIASSDEYHAAHVIEGLRHDKYVFIEKAMALCMRDADAIIGAEKKSKGKVFVGYMRRYAAAFLDAVKEIGGIEEILYARVRGMESQSDHSVRGKLNQDCPAQISLGAIATLLHNPAPSPKFSQILRRRRSKTRMIRLRRS